MFACTDSATLFNTFAVLCTQHRWCGVPGKTSSSAFQKPSAPSPTAISGVIVSPRLFTSMRSSRHLCALSRTPIWKPMSFFLPYGVVPMSNSMHSLWSSMRACRNTPSAHTYRYRRADKSRFCQCPYSPCHSARRCVMERRQFTREFKLEAVRLIKQRGVSYAQASKDLGVHPTQLRNWVKQLADDPQHAFPGHGQMKPEQLEIAQLKREVAKLRAERDILKKAAAYFAKEST